MPEPCSELFQVSWFDGGVYLSLMFMFFLRTNSKFTCVPAELICWQGFGQLQDLGTSSVASCKPLCIVAKAYFCTAARTQHVRHPKAL